MRAWLTSLLLFACAAARAEIASPETVTLKQDVPAYSVYPPHDQRGMFPAGGTLTVLGADEGLACKPCGVVYPVRDDIPIMLVEEAVPQADWDAGKRSVKD